MATHRGGDRSGGRRASLATPPARGSRGDLLLRRAARGRGARGSRAGAAPAVSRGGDRRDGGVAPAPPPAPTPAPPVARRPTPAALAPPAGLARCGRPGGDGTRGRERGREGAAGRPPCRRRSGDGRE